MAAAEFTLPYEPSAMPSGCYKYSSSEVRVVYVTNGFTYSEAIYKLGDNNIIPKEFAYRFVYIAGLRNFLSHDYLKDTVTELEKFLEAGLKDVKEFLGFLK